MAETFDIQNLYYVISQSSYSLKYLWSTTLGGKDIEIWICCKDSNPSRLKSFFAINFDHLQKE